jgi:hypothetical protein
VIRGEKEIGGKGLAEKIKIKKKITKKKKKKSKIFTNPKLFQEKKA